MAITPINATRVSQNMRTDFILESVRQSQRQLLLSQTRIASGHTFVSPSEDPVASNRALDLTLALERQNRFSTNASLADNTLAATDSAMTEISGLVIQALTIASQDLSNLTSADERFADAELIAGIRSQLQVIGNRQFNGRFLFAGRETQETPFVDTPGGIAYIGDTGDLVTRVSDGVIDSFNVPGHLLFGALSAKVAGDKELTPILTETVRLEDLGGASGQGIRTGKLVFNEAGGVGVFTVDVARADTIGDVVEAINQAAEQAGSNLTAAMGDQGLEITPGGAAVSITDTSAGLVAGDLGILTPDETTATVEGADIHARITALTPIEALAGGVGIDLEGGLILQNGAKIATIDLTGAQTVQDIINSINQAGVFVLARINDAGTGLDLFNQVSGSALTIAENGGTTAADLGLRTLDSSTPLSGLNYGRGVSIAGGDPDLHITAKDGSLVAVDLEGAITVGDVVDRINEAAQEAGVSIAAELVTTGNGIQITDGTGGTGDLVVGGTDFSTAAVDLGLVKSAVGDETEIVGDDPSGVRTEGILGALKDLEDALRRDDSQAIGIAAERVEVFQEDVTRIHGVTGAKSQAMKSKVQQLQDASQSTQVFLSEVKDLDFAEAVTELQTAQNQLEAGLQTGSILLNLSLLDFLR